MDQGRGTITRIQDAVDNTSDGDSVFVYSGFYNETVPTLNCCVYINKSISLLGEDKNTTIIDGSFLYSVIGIMADDVVIQGLTVQHSGRYAASPLPSGVLVNPPSAGVLEHILVFDMIIMENHVGLDVGPSANSTFRNNIITGNKWGCLLSDNELGILMVFDVSWVAINTIRNNRLGIRVADSGGMVECNNFLANDIHAQFSWDTPFPALITVLRGVRWDRNYWDTWEKTSPKPIIGTVTRYIVILLPPLCSLDYSVRGSSLDSF
ncbi:MAG: hypothetical protein KKC68_05515 [Candidatus Thermoplasmatota archaeon]|nr:hypothetical protein [Candidatus Thermoplasmatota archaeon]MBU1941213.1 hypothetical protein [Candidatus Thermoplasmatota archaeon]